MAFEAEQNSVANIWIGTWKNEKGSVMRIAGIDISVITGNDQPHFLIKGTYETGVGDVSEGAVYPLTGWVIGDIIAFSVSFHGRDADGNVGRSVTSWSGQYLPEYSEDRTKVAPADENEVLKTLWHLTPDMADGDHEEEYGWVIAWSGSDNFHKVSSDPTVSL